MNFNKQISLDVSDHPLSVRASEIFARCLRERCPAEILVNQSGGYPIEITLSQDIPGEAFAIEEEQRDCASLRDVGWV